jgi:hypothetical protein
MLPKLTGKLHASHAMKEAARVGKFVPLAHFLPSASGVIRTRISSASANAIEDEYLARSSFDRDPQAITRAFHTNHAEVPRFKRWEDVATAFLGGLAPIACLNNPRRLQDYHAFFNIVSYQHAMGAEHWPVLLDYIEQRRRAKQPDGMDPSSIAARASHTLCDETDLTTTSFSFLEGEQYQQVRFNWDCDPFASGEEDFVDLDILRMLTKTAPPASSLTKGTLSFDIAADAAPPSSSRQRPSPSTRSPTTGSSAQLTTEQVELLKATGSCINHVAKVKCLRIPCTFTHRSLEEAQRKSDAGNPASTTGAGRGQ